MEEVENYFLQPGFIFVSDRPHLIHTVLGSCVSVCLWDSANGFGGMNHYIYGRSLRKTGGARYGDLSIPYLLRLIKEAGSKIEDLKAHIIGGAENPELNSAVGRENVQIAEEIMNRNGIRVVSRDTGGVLGRKVIFNNATGEILVYKVQSIRRNDWYTYHG